MYWQEIKALFPDESINQAGLPLLDDLNAEQRAVYDVLVGHNYQSILCWHEWFNEHQWKLLGTTEE
jgi:hypothetical protein